MAQLIADRRDVDFVLHEQLNVAELSKNELFQDFNKKTIDMIVSEARNLAIKEILPTQKLSDEGCVFDNGEVRVPEEYHRVFKLYNDGEWLGMIDDPKWGGQGMPKTVSLAANEYFYGANPAFMLYHGLTHGAGKMIETIGSETQKKLYLKHIYSGEWSGTMLLTEPNAGSDVGALESTARKNPDGTYSITGSKIFISGGEHNMVKNIIHPVLARIEGAPEGVKGISLFVVPKYILDKDGQPGERNSLQCGGLEEKMGIHGNATCVMNYDEATGWLVGEENKGLKIMFVMMNEARLGVGLQGLAVGEVAYQNALAFAKDRLQGRSLTGPKNPDGPADPIIVHPDVRRMLMDQKCFVEAARCLVSWTALHGDLEEKSGDPEQREKSGDYMSLLTPVVKAYLTDKGFLSVSNGLQVFGGSGYVEEWGMSQFMRDARITLIYEGTNGIQALDLVGRKLAMNGMRPIHSFFDELDAFAAAGGSDATQPFLDAVAATKAQLKEATDWLVENGLKDFNNAGASSHDYLQLFGLTCLTYMWGLMAKAAEAGDASDPFYSTKLSTGRYFLDRWVPEGGMHLAKVKAGAASMMALEAEAF